jgi:two-component system, sensor histidine kinase
VDAADAATQCRVFDTRIANARAEAQTVDGPMRFGLRQSSALQRYGLAIAVTLVTTAVALTVRPFVEPDASPPYLLAVLMVAWFLGFGPAVLTCALSILALDYFFIAPLYALGLDPHDLAATGVFAAVALIMGWLAATLRRSRDERADLLTREQAAHASAREARETAEAANHAKNEFLAVLGHELRNPLSAMLAALRVLERVGKHEDLTTNARQIIERQTHHVTRLVDDLMDVNRLMAGKTVLALEPMDLASAVRHCVTTLSGAGRLDRHAVKLDTVSAWVQADAVRLEQVIVNLLENAVKYTPPGGSILVTTRSDGHDAVLAVRDSGVGIAPDLLSRVFEPFVQGSAATRARAGGLGIGLAVVRSVVEMHGGRVRAVSEGPGRGSTFTVRLPAVAAIASPAPTAPPPAPTSRRRRILVIEDDTDTRVMLRAALELEGHEVYDAGDGEKAVDLVERLRPDVVIADIDLPGSLDGRDVARRIRALPRGAEIFLLALTGFGRPDDRRRSFEAGFDTHVTKPVDPADLVAIIAARG